MMFKTTLRFLRICKYAGFLELNWNFQMNIDKKPGTKFWRFQKFVKAFSNGSKVAVSIYFVSQRLSRYEYDSFRAKQKIRNDSIFIQFDRVINTVLRDPSTLNLTTIFLGYLLVYSEIKNQSNQTHTLLTTTIMIFLKWTIHNIKMNANFISFCYPNINTKIVVLKITH